MNLPALRLPSGPASVADLFRLEDAIARELPPVECPVRDFFLDGMYVREMRIPANTVATGAVHKKPHFVVLWKGVVTLITQSGRRTLFAPCSFFVADGGKKAVFAHSDAMICTYHTVESRDRDAVVRELTDLTADQLLGGPNDKRSQFQLSKEQPSCLLQT